MSRISPVASDRDSNPCLAHVSHETVMELGLQDNRIAGVAESSDIVALQLSGGGRVWRSVFAEIVFAFHCLSRCTVPELVGTVSFVQTIHEYAAGEAVDQWGVLATFLVLRLADLRD